MDFGFTTEQQQFRQEVQSFFRSSEVQSELLSIKEKDPDARRLYNLMGKHGLLAANWPIEYGGRASSMIEAAIVAEEMARFGVPDTLHLLSIQVVGSLILLAGNKAQKEFFLPRMALGEIFAAVLYSEPKAGSDLSSLSTEAKPCDEENYCLYGQKIYNLKTHLADYGLCAVRTSRRASKYQEITLFMVPLHIQGVTIQPIRSMADEQFHEVLLDGVRVSRDLIIGKLDEGWPLMTKAIAFERTGLDYYLRAQRWFNAVCQRAVEKQRNTNNSVVQEIGRLGARLEAAKLLTWRVLTQLNNEETNDVTAAMSKLYSSELAKAISWKALEFEGLEGCLSQEDERAILNGLFEAAYREAPGLTMSAGTSEIMLQTIANSGFDLP